ncbi:MAG: aldose epimerase family protein, partial [Bacteroidota bacterium]
MNCHLFFIIALLLAVGCTPSSNTEDTTTSLDLSSDSSTDNMQPTLSIQTQSYGTINDTTVQQYILKNANDMEVRIIEYGGIITHLFVPDRDGQVKDIVLGFDELSRYQETHPYFGALIGRYGNRIANSQFELDGETYKLTANETPHHLHGGVEGFDKRVWKGEAIEEEERVGVKLQLTSPDGDQGYPGNLAVTVIYSLNNDNELRIKYKATTDQATPVNLTNHSYFNLNGAGNKGVENHDLMIAAQQVTSVNGKLIPTGDLMAVENTPFDFQSAKPIGQEIAVKHPQMNPKVGYDHNFVFTAHSGTLKKQATVVEPKSGRSMEVWTTEPGVQLYVPNYKEQFIIDGKAKKKYEGRAAFCLETQHFPNSPNEASFPSTILEPNETY